MIFLLFRRCLHRRRRCLCVSVRLFQLFGWDCVVDVYYFFGMYNQNRQCFSVCKHLPLKQK